MTATVADIIKIMETIAPPRLAEKWDNVGLQIGQNNWPVKTVMVALDPLYDVVAAAVREDVDLLITHHPLIFQPINRIDFSSPVGSIIHMAASRKIAIYAAHTNFDNAQDGLNDILALKIGLKNLKVLGKAAEPDTCKIVVYVPVEYEQKILDALFMSKSGKIGAYTCCSFRTSGKGTFRPDSGAKPFIGKTGEISHVDETRIETVVQRNDIANVVNLLKANHPYETMAYDIYPLLTRENGPGTGRIGEIDKKIELAFLALRIKEKLGIESVKVAGKPDLTVHAAAVCTGSGSSLIKNFLSSEAEVYISGDLRYHDARAVEAAGRGLIDIGHFASEHLIVKELAGRLEQILYEAGIDVKVKACGLENDPFVIY